MTVPVPDPWILLGVGALSGAVTVLLLSAVWHRRPRARGSGEVNARDDPGEAIRRSEERLLLAVVGSNDTLFDYDHGRRVLVLSDTFQRWLGGSGSGARFREVELDDVMSRIPPDHADGVYRAMLACAERGESFDVEFPLMKPDGGQLWLQVRGRGVPLEAGYRVSGFASDISRRKLAERLLRDSVDRLGAVLDHIAEGILTLDDEGRICSLNPAAQQMLGVDRDGEIGQALCERVILDEPFPGWPMLADRQPRAAQMRRGDGTTFPAELAVSTMEVRSDERFILVLRDVTAQRLAEDRLRAAIAESQAATRVKDEFLATMSHEIRTPMNGVLGMTQLLLDMDLNAEQRETAQLIRSSGESLLTIINDILDFTRAGSGRLRVDELPFDLRQCVREVVDLLGRRRSPVDLYVDYPSQVPGWLVGDAGRVRQVLVNLVGNALKFTRSGHVAVTVESLDASAAAGPPDGRVRLKVSVTDTGPGIPESARSSVFEPFTQADASATRRFGGTGLGLAISRRLVELIGGEIGLESSPGQGSCFWFTLNLPPAEPVASLPAPSLQGVRVLLVDDDACGRDIHRRCLASAGAAVTAVASAPDALQRLEGEQFDLALIDDQMPDMDGLLLSELIRIDPGWARMRIVLMCTTGIRGVDESDAVDRALVKPLMPDYLIQELTALLVEGTAERSARTSRQARAAVPLHGDRPLGPTTEPAAETGAETVPAPGAAAAHPEPPRLLLAEDNLVNQQVAVRMLEKLGCRVDVAASGAEAVELWQRFAYDLVFMDCQMPELDGLAAARQIRALEAAGERSRTPIVAMTANAMDQDRADCLAVGMDDYLSKPVNQAELAGVLARWAFRAPGRANMQER